MTKKLQDKVAIVTGASKGIGAEIAKHLAAEGAKVVVNYSKSKEGADRVVNEIKKQNGNAVAIQADMSNPSDIKRLFQETNKAFGNVDILVNNAGVYEFATIDKITPDHFRKMFDLNVLGLILASQEAVNHFGNRGGNIINISSVAAKISPATTTVYSATKAAVDSITSSLAKELASKGIRVNSINPGLVETEGVFAMQATTGGNFIEENKAKIPLGRVGQPHDIAPAVVFLASNDAKWITGETFVISGGMR